MVVTEAAPGRQMVSRPVNQTLGERWAEFAESAIGVVQRPGYSVHRNLYTGCAAREIPRPALVFGKDEVCTLHPSYFHLPRCIRYLVDTVLVAWPETPTPPSGSLYHKVVGSPVYHYRFACAAIKESFDNGRSFPWFQNSGASEDAALADQQRNKDAPQIAPPRKRLIDWIGAISWRKSFEVAKHCKQVRQDEVGEKQEVGATTGFSGPGVDTFLFGYRMQHSLNTRRPSHLLLHILDMFRISNRPQYCASEILEDF